TLWDGTMTFPLIVYIPVLFLGIPLNLIAFWVFCCKIKRWTETRVYMINLTVADSFLLFAIPFVIYFIRYNHPKDKLCRIIHSIYFINMPMSIFIITLIAIDRYIAIKFPLKAKVLRSPLKSASVCGFLWILMIINTYLHPQLYETSEESCFGTESIQHNYVMIVSSTLGYFIPLGIVIFCSVQVIRCLKKKTDNGSHERKLVQKAIHIVSVNLCVFIICFSPLYITMVLHFVVDVAGACSLMWAVNLCRHVSSCFANCNCCLDAFCYYFAAKEFQEFP
ncbi:GPR35 protein, partial [Psilopogon haemacephalus]|nr:GPR35 protein [Psilopogon haemacephalus]